MGAAYSDYPRTTQLLIARGAEVNARSADGLTALHYAAGAGNTEIVDLLLMAGADPNASSVDGTTPLMRAARAGRDATVKRLNAGGATADAILRQARVEIDGRAAPWQACRCRSAAQRIMTGDQPS